MITMDRRSRKVVLKLERVDRAAKRGVRQGAFKAGHGLIQEANQAILKKPKTGRTYFVRTRTGRRRHRASAPGESHANLTGAARRSLQFQIKGSQSLEFGYGASRYDAPDYTEYLEGGTRKMKERPTLGNAISAQERDIEAHLLNEIDKAVRK